MAGYINRHAENLKGSENPMVKHEKYLIAMEKQNKFLRKMNMKDKIQEKKEKLEAGFSPYVNGANANPTVLKQKPLKTPRTFRAKTADPGDILFPVEDDKSQNYARANTAPEKRRKFWGQRSVQIVDETGTKLEVAREDQDYSEDFDDLDDSLAFQLNSLSGSLGDTIEEEIFQTKGRYQEPKVDTLNDSISSAEVIAEEIMNMSFDGADSLPVLGQNKENSTDKFEMNQTFLVEKPTEMFVDKTDKCEGKKLVINKSKRIDLPQKNAEVISGINLPMQKSTTNVVPKSSTKQSSPKRSNMSSHGEKVKKNWLEESWNSLELFNQSHLGRIQNPGQELEEIFEELNIVVPEPPSEHTETSEDEFEIPLLPCGKNLTINIHTTWGDKHYVGLNGIEVFSKDGCLAKISKITANPPDINILPGYHNDPRRFTNLLNGVNQTCDDINMWLAPYTAGASHLIHIMFAEPTHLAAIRIWNYNKSRIHSHRGAKDITVTLDDKLIFCGEIKKASGVATGDLDSFGDNILFTVDDNILEKIADNDAAFPDNSYLLQAGDFSTQVTKRPMTGDKVVDVQRERPFTSIVGKTAVTAEIETSGTYCVKCIKLRLISNWGGSHIGLVGLQMLGEESELIPIELHRIKLMTNKLAGGGDASDINRIINGTNITMDSNKMWQIPFSGNPCVISVNFVQAVQITGFRVWNYNASFEDTYSGVKEVVIELDGQVFTTNSFVLRRAPGHVHYDFAQDVQFESKKAALVGSPSFKPKNNAKTAHNHPHSDQYETPNAPTGFVYKFELLDTWGDLYYIGLNGIELYDEHGQLLKLTENEIAAFPSSVNILDQSLDDVRTPDKLINGINDTLDGRNMWLSPVLPGQVNLIYVVFDFPVTISMIKIWNYAKTTSRGVKTVAILVDDLLIYNGFLPPVRPKSSQVKPHVIQFTDQGGMDSQPTEITQDIQFTNNNRVLSAKYKKQVDQDLRPMTAMGPNQKIFKARF